MKGEKSNEAKLILISGMSDAGKSTTSQQLAKQYERNSIEHLWLHEEIANHPIREGEFEIGDRLTEVGMSQNVADMYERWTRLVEKIDKSSRVYIMEGYLYQNIVRHFFPRYSLLRFFIAHVPHKRQGVVRITYHKDYLEGLSCAYELL